jgi:hypothetical protein
LGESILNITCAQANCLVFKVYDVASISSGGMIAEADPNRNYRG